MRGGGGGRSGAKAIGGCEEAGWVLCAPGDKCENARSMIDMSLLHPPLSRLSARSAALAMQAANDHPYARTADRVVFMLRLMRENSFEYILPSVNLVRVPCPATPDIPPPAWHTTVAVCVPCPATPDIPPPAWHTTVAV